MPKCRKGNLQTITKHSFPTNLGRRGEGGRGARSVKVELYTLGSLLGIFVAVKHVVL